MICHYVWTFRITGGDPFSIYPDRNPALHHDGRTTIWHLVGSDTYSKEVETEIRSFGGKVDVFCQRPTDGEIANKLKISGRGLELPDPDPSDAKENA